MFEEQNKASRKFLYFSVITVNLAAFSIGTGFAWSSPSVPILQGKRGNNPLDEPLLPYQASLVASLLGIGAIFSPFLAIISDKIGRKKTLLSSTTVIFASFLIITFAKAVWLFYLARFLCGFAIGWYFVIIPNYIAELSEKENRGTLSCFLKLNITLGILLIYCVGPYIDLTYSGVVCLIPPVLNILLVGIYVPESPYYLVAKGRKEEAELVLLKLRPRRDVQEELFEITENVKESFENKGYVFDIFRNKDLLKCLVITTGLVIFQQFSGINAIIFYLQTIFNSTGSDFPPEISTIIIGVVQFLSSVITPFFIDRLGRRFFLFASGLGTSISLISLGTYFHLKAVGIPTDTISWLPISSLIVFIIAYTVGFGPLPFTVLGEIFPPNMKATASTITICTCFSFTFLTTLFFPYLRDLIGTAQSFWFFGACSAGSLLFTHFLVPETKMKSFTEIQRMLNIHPKQKCNS